MMAGVVVSDGTVKLKGAMRPEESSGNRSDEPISLFSGLPPFSARMSVHCPWVALSPPALQLSVCVAVTSVPGDGDEGEKLHPSWKTSPSAALAGAAKARVPIHSAAD